ncbi:hypothetical protein [Marivita sp. S2033]|uniref:hypothetical protein n=1 Tax=Marivita sp. S2033 TaxID=3373187 RepID=UPI003981C271
MDVILHLGAHRTGATSFQRYMAQARAEGVAFWGPPQTRGGMLDGVHDYGASAKTLARLQGRLALRMAQTKARGAEVLVISDAALIGPVPGVRGAPSLYPQIGTRMARIDAAFGGRIGSVALQIRALDGFWASVMALSLARGALVPTPEYFARIAQDTRSWRDVIVELSCAMPDVAVVVTSFEQFAQRPDLVASHLAHRAMPCMPSGGIWANRSLALPQLRAALACTDPSQLRHLPEAEGRWQPFSSAQRQTLRALYAADLAWLRGGADGLARYHEHPTPMSAARADGAAGQTRGSKDNDIQERDMARPC